MHTVNMLQAKTNLSRLVESIEQGSEREIIIARNGKAAAKLVAVDMSTQYQRIGVAKGIFNVPDNIDVSNDEVAAMFHTGNTK
ncbi:MAG: type II toxin-antitoxin system Phd/YefM family antitoxin [Methylotenera sp.]|nr:type II toxin-antitoxin system Phd/YefM family antitoxin [Methylotenera sp.]